jgi:hypothetical protein
MQLLFKLLGGFLEFKKELIPLSGMLFLEVLLL